MLDRRRGHDLGEKIIREACTYSREGLLSGGPISLDRARDRVEAALLAVGDLLSMEGMVPGHLKALLQAGDCQCVLSVTEAGRCDVRTRGSLEGPQVWQLTVNLISAISPAEPPDLLVDGLFED